MDNNFKPDNKKVPTNELSKEQEEKKNLFGLSEETLKDLYSGGDPEDIHGRFKK